jgi:hypothetical protein
MIERKVRLTRPRWGSIRQLWTIFRHDLEPCAGLYGESWVAVISFLTLASLLLRRQVCWFVDFRGLFDRHWPGLTGGAL